VPLCFDGGGVFLLLVFYPLIFSFARNWKKVKRSFWLQKENACAFPCPIQFLWTIVCSLSFRICTWLDFRYFSSKCVIAPPYTTMLLPSSPAPTSLILARYLNSFPLFQFECEDLFFKICLQSEIRPNFLNNKNHRTISIPIQSIFFLFFQF